LSREGSLSCNTYCDTGPRFFRSHPKDRSNQSPLTTHMGMRRTYSNPDPHGCTVIVRTVRINNSTRDHRECNVYTRSRDRHICVSLMTRPLNIEFFCLFVWFESHEQFFSYLATVTIVGDRAANLDLCLALTALSSEGSFTSHTYCDTGPPFLKSYPKDP
jgi:hypothetical protein